MDFYEGTSTIFLGMFIGFCLGCAFMRWWIADVFLSAYRLLHTAMEADLDVTLKSSGLDIREAEINRRASVLRQAYLQRLIDSHEGKVSQ